MIDAQYSPFRGLGGRYINYKQMKDHRIDQYIDQSTETLQPVIIHIRELMHRALPDVVETIKWNSPCFMANDKIICVIQAFKKHVNFVFHKAPETPDTDTFLVDIGERSKMKGLKQLTQVSEIPDEERMIAFIRNAAGTN